MAVDVPPPPPPPIVSIGPTMPQRTDTARIVTWSAALVRCDGVPVAPALAPDPEPAFVPVGNTVSIVSVEVPFRIDARGRPLSIGQPTRFAPGADGLPAALAATRFPAGPERSGCTVRFMPAMTPLAEAPAAVQRAAILWSGPFRPPELARSLVPPGSTCTAPPPDPRRILFPPFKQLGRVPGRRQWTLVGYDLDARGHPRDVVTRGGSGNVAFDRAAVAAITGSRFEPGARSGCIYPYHLTAEVLPAPPRPTREEARARANLPVDTCPADLAWVRPPPNFYPQPFRLRAIEGWAAVAFDVATWGEVGNVRVLAAEPAAEFGRTAVQMVQGGMKQPSPRGATGCIQIVRFALSSPDLRPNETIVPEVRPAP